MEFTPRFMATAIGSMPFTDVDRAVDLSLETLTEAPIWPQLPNRGFREHFLPQYCEGMPRLVIEETQRRISFDTSGDCSEALAEFYQTYLTAVETGDCSAMAISPAHSAGIYAMEERLRANAARLPFIKVHTSGPCTFALTIVDQNKQSVYYNTDFRDVVIKTLAMKCRWQIQKFAPFAERVICFVDDPSLSAYGSSTYVGVLREDVVATLAEVIQAIHAEGALAGVHCCGNTEWSILVDAGADIVNFDAFDFGHTIAMYPDAVKAHLHAGGVLAWGVVPTLEAIREQTVGGLADHLEKMMDHLAAKGIDKQLIAQQAMITPACGTGSMSAADAEAVFRIVPRLAEAMRTRYGFESV